MHFCNVLVVVSQFETIITQHDVYKALKDKTRKQTSKFLFIQQLDSIRYMTI